MPKQTTVRFNPVARLQKILGNELISDPNLAVIELVKNSYDAGASQVVIKLRSADKELRDQVMVVTDNGTGMDRDLFEKAWMAPGYSDKAAEAGRQVPLPEGVVNEATVKAKSRTQTGEKGLGRLAVARLADKVRVETRPRQSDDWVVVEIDWSQFDRMDIPLTSVEIPLNLVREIDDTEFNTGTTLILSGLKVDWSARIPGRPAPGRSRIRLGRLKQDLAMLLLPLPGQKSAGFQVRIETDAPALQEFTGDVDPLNRELSGYSFRFVVTPALESFKVNRVLERTPGVAKIAGKPVRDTELVTHAYAEFGQDLSNAQPCGQFKGTFYYQPDLPRSAYGKAGVPGILLYRDGVRVEPYGLDGDDWLGATAWKAARQGHAPIQPHQLVGYVQITYEDNPHLLDMSNRLGMIDNSQFQTFLAIAKQEFRWFGALIYDEYVSNWPRADTRLQLRAEHAQEFTRLLLQELTHSIRQSTAGLGAEMTRLTVLADNDEVDTITRTTIRRIIGNSKAHITQIDDVVNRALDLERKELGTIDDVSLDSVVVHSIETLRLMGNSLGVSLKRKRAPNALIKGSRVALERALNVLGSNAIEAAAERGDAPEVVFELQQYKDSRSGENGWKILVIDNGPGIEPSILDKLLESTVSTKGRQGTGLSVAKELLMLFGSDLRLASTKPSGTTMEVIVPSRARLRGYKA